MIEKDSKFETPTVQVYCRKPSLGESKALLDMGVELVAWDVRPDDGKGLLISRMIRDQIRDAGMTSTLLVHSRKIAQLVTIAKMVQPDYLLMSSDRDDSKMIELARLIQPHSKLMMSVPVVPVGESASFDSVSLAKEYSEYAGALTVDTCLTKSAKVFGCTGVVNDWKVCKQIIDSVDIPVVLAGGLNSTNIVDAIKTVNPEIVDACTSLELGDKSKDLGLCQEFYEKVKQAYDQ